MTPDEGFRVILGTQHRKAVPFTCLPDHVKRWRHLSGEELHVKDNISVVELPMASIGVCRLYLSLRRRQFKLPVINGNVPRLTFYRIVLRHRNKIHNGVQIK